MFFTRPQANILFAILVAAVLAGVISLVLTLVNYRLDPGFVDRWFRAYLISLAAGIPSAILFLPVLRKVADRFVR